MCPHVSNIGVILSGEWNHLLNVAIHGHFYQPPREDPLTGLIPPDPTSAPFHDWNERICSECYLPVSEARLLAPDGRIAERINAYAYLSFNMGPTLHRWIEHYESHLNSLIISSGKKAIAQCYNHIIMPLASERDKRTQIIWGIKDFEYRFKRKPKGMWLPETAVDLNTLEILSQEGILFTILAPRQCRAVVTVEGTRQTPNGYGLDVTLPYRCELPSGRSISIVFYDGAIAHDIAFGGLLDNADLFCERLLRAARHGEDRLMAVAVDGETFGHHHKFGEMALARLFTLLNANSDVSLPDIGEFIEKHPPINRCVLAENSSWSCIHGVERWRSDCGCHTGGIPSWNQQWRAPLRTAFDNLRQRMDFIYEERCRLECDPWKLRNESVSLWFSQNDEADSRERFAAKNLAAAANDTRRDILTLLEAQRLGMFMYTSCAWFFNDISGVETKHAIACAVRAAELCFSVSGEDLLTSLLKDLDLAHGNSGAAKSAAVIARREFARLESFDIGAVNYQNNDVRESIIEKDKVREGGSSMAVMNYGGNLAQSLLYTLERDPALRNVAYFSMEIGLTPDIPTYSGGLGVLAGDILKSASDLGVPMVGITLLYKKGYFAQKVGKDFRQEERPVDWSPEAFLSLLPNKITIAMNKRNVTVGVWSLILTGISGHPLPIFFLDTDLPENTPEDRALTAELYGGDNKYRLCQELILGIGGLRLLRDMGFRNIDTFHLNEGHAGFITLELLREQGYEDIEKIRNKVIFTTHTPVAAGHDFFSYNLIDEVLDSNFVGTLRRIIGGSGLSMTDLALKFSRYVNGVSRKHAQVSRSMFADDSIDWVTNGVHSATWTSPGFAKLYDEYARGWRNDPSRLMQAFHIPDAEIWKAHQAAKMKLLALVLEETGRELSPDILTIGFARRAATYKRADLVFSDIKRLLEIGAGKIQFIFSGKAHPHDEPGKDILQKICRLAAETGKELPIVFLENYNMGPAKLITSGVDLWLNTPIRPREASGTSGMKCVHNGVMNFSVLDGWWIEGCIEDKTGWGIGPEPKENDTNEDYGGNDANSLYDKLEEKIIPAYYMDRPKWIRMMKTAIAVNASYFNTHRVVKEYCEKAYGTVFRGH